MAFEDREFAKLSIPLPDDKQEELENSILEEGCKEPILVWEGKIIDGYKRYRICRQFGIKYQEEEVKFRTRRRAIEWICEKRCNEAVEITVAVKYIVGRWCVAVTGNEVIKMLATRYGVLPETIRVYVRMAKLLDRMDLLDPVFVDMVLQEKVRVGRTMRVRMAEMDDAQLQRTMNRLSKGMDKPRDPNQMRYKRKMTDQERAKRIEQEETIQLKMGVKDIPEFDPDAELKGMLFTIPSWMNALKQAVDRSDLTLVSEQVKRHVITTLLDFNEMNLEIMEAMKDEQPIGPIDSGTEEMCSEYNSRIDPDQKSGQ